MSNFSFSHSVFKRLVHQTFENKGLFGKGLTPVCHSIAQKNYILFCLMFQGNTGSHSSFTETDLRAARLGIPLPSHVLPGFHPSIQGKLIDCLVFFAILSFMIAISQRPMVLAMLFKTFYAPVSKDQGHIVLPLSVCPSVRLSSQT